MPRCLPVRLEAARQARWPAARPCNRLRPIHQIHLNPSRVLQQAAGSSQLASKRKPVSWPRGQPSTNQIRGTQGETSPVSSSSSSSSSQLVLLEPPTSSGQPTAALSASKRQLAASSRGQHNWRSCIVLILLPSWPRRSPQIKWPLCRPQSSKLRSAGAAFSSPILALCSARKLPPRCRGCICQL